jgi:bacterioferritin-associated ferredoxin
MQLDDDVCLCFHVSKRKVLNFIRIHRPRRPGQIAECHGAGTGCGWCRRYLEELLAQSQGTAPALPTRQQYAAMRKKYLEAKKRG